MSKVDRIISNLLGFPSFSRQIVLIRFLVHRSSRFVHLEIRPGKKLEKFAKNYYIVLKLLYSVRVSSFFLFIFWRLFKICLFQRVIKFSCCENSPSKTAKKIRIIKSKVAYKMMILFSPWGVNKKSEKLTEEKSFIRLYIPLPGNK